MRLIYTQPHLILTMKGFRMSHPQHHHFSKKTLSLRQKLADLLCGRVFSRLHELERQINTLNRRLNDQASVVAHMGSLVTLNTTTEGTNGKLSAKVPETNLTRTHSDLNIKFRNASRTRSADTSAHYTHLNNVETDNSSYGTCFSGWNDSGCDTSSSCSGGASCD